jgi:Cu/Ag efflux pump CusA
MNLISFALKKPITILVLVAGLFFFGIKAVNTIKIDIFPKLDMPVIYVSHPFGGYTPKQMESFFAKQYINIFLFVNGNKKYPGAYADEDQLLPWYQHGAGRR